MSPEYVRLSPSEQIHGETNLLQTQVSILTMLKQYQEYELLRKEELFMKIDLKKKIGEAREFLDILGRSLPESKFIEEQEKKERMQKQVAEKIEAAIQSANKKEALRWTEKEPKAAKASAKKEETKKSSLDKQLEEIRLKLEKLEQSS